MSACLLAAMGAACSSGGTSSCPCTADASSPLDSSTESASDTAWTDAYDQQVLDFCGATSGFQAALAPACCTEDEQDTDPYKLYRDATEALAYECRIRLLQSASGGRIELDEEASSACAQAFQDTYAARGCEMLWTGIDWEASSCRQAIRGMQPEGAPCRYRYECVDGLTCQGHGWGLDGTCGQPQAGGSCRVLESTLAVDHVIDSMLGHHPACASGWVCLHITGGNGICMATTAQGGACAWDAECDPGLRCHLGRCGTEGPAGEGSACRSATDCLQRLYCEAPGGEAQGVCAQRRSAGQACVTSHDTCSGLCISGDGGQSGTCVDFCGSD